MPPFARCPTLSPLPYRRTQWPTGRIFPKLLATARTSGHEYLIAVPLEPAGFPLNDPGKSTLLTSAPASAKCANPAYGLVADRRLRRGDRRDRHHAWRAAGAMTDQMEAMLSEFSRRGLLYVDPREGSGQLSRTWGRHVDLVIDDAARPGRGRSGDDRQQARCA